MRELLTSGRVGNIELNAQRKMREDIQNRWTKLGLAEGLNGYVKDNITTLYENEARHLIHEATASDNSGAFETVAFPMIRRVFSKLLANDIVSVQAMNLPIGKLFFIKPVTSDRQWTNADGTVNIDAQNLDHYAPKGGEVGSHRGLMGYEREDRNQGGAQNNRYYLPDEVINTGADMWQVTYNGLPLAETASQKSAKGYATEKEAQAKVGTEMYLPNETAAVKANGFGRVKPEVTQWMTKTLYDLFYDDFMYDNSKGKIHIKLGSTELVQLNPMGQVAPLVTPIVDPLTNSITSIMLRVKGFSNVNQGRLTGPDGNEMDTEAFIASLKVVCNIEELATGADGYATFKQGEKMNFRFVTQKYAEQIAHYSKYCTDDGQILIEVDLTKPVKMGSTAASINGYIGVDPANAEQFTNKTFAATWAEYDSLELETEMGEVSFQLASVMVSVEERKLRATWSPELAQDVSAFHNIDAEAELTAILSEQIGAEIDREILRDLRKLAPWQVRWDYYGWQRLAKQSTVYTQKDWNQTLMTKINQISAQIQKSTLRGGANFIVVSAEISAVLNDLEYFHVSDASAESDQYNMGIEKTGALQGRYQVIVDPYSPHYSLIMGHHGTSLLDTGYVYAPYIPMALTPTMFNPFNFAPIKGISTRYAKKMVNNKYYGAIICDGLTHWDVNELR